MVEYGCFGCGAGKQGGIGNISLLILAQFRIIRIESNSSSRETVSLNRKVRFCKLTSMKNKVNENYVFQQN